MFNLDPGKLLVIGVVAIILLGPDRLPQVARQLGGAWRTFNEFRHRMESEVRSTMPDLPPTSEIARLARSPSALLNHLSNMSSDEEPDGSFQPPTPVSENGTADAAAVAPAHPAAAEPDPDTGTDAPAEAQPAPAPKPSTAPTYAPRASQPSGVVVPGDPTLN
jgi:sec-independent protein translocase protein TatB